MNQESAIWKKSLTDLVEAFENDSLAWTASAEESREARTALNKAYLRTRELLGPRVIDGNVLNPKYVVADGVFKIPSLE